MRVALVHDHLAQDGGAEKVLRVFQEMFPKSPTFVLVYDPKRTNPIFQRRDIRTSFIQRLPGGVTHYQWYLPLMPTATESFNLDGFDVVLSSSSMFAKGVITQPETLHIAYCHTPTRYLWSDSHRYLNELHIPKILKRITPFLLTNIRMWDYLAAARADQFVANSKIVRERIQKYYGRESTVITPPVEVEQFEVATAPGTYFLAGGRLVAYKRLDIVIEAFNRIRRPLKIFGDGPERKYLESRAEKNITFVGKVSDVQLRALYRDAIAFINPQEEDLGITPIESMAAGRPVIAYGRGGAIETILPGKTGVFVDEQSWEAIADAVVRLKANAWDAQAIRAHAEQFSVNAFKEKMMAFITTSWEAWKSSRVTTLS
jgi:glycosyltransferase involved in cell wall biosynthesis